MKDNLALKSAPEKSGVQGQKKLKANFDIKGIFKRGRSFFTAQRIIFIVLGLSIVLLAVAFLYPLFGFKNLKISLPENKVVNLPVEASKGEVKSYDFYLQGVRSKQIFAAGDTSSEEAPGPMRVDVDAMKDMNLIGVIAGDNPQAIIEDKKVQKTYYLSKGQFIGELKVEDIQESRVILNRQGEKFELHL